jgi:DNA uptake protein ComE-like DNA-binding protein
VPAAGLRWDEAEAENDGVRTRTQVTALAVAILCASLAGIAQNQDRAPYRNSRKSASAPPAEARIDINHATLGELLKMPGMTPSWAGRIVRFRTYRTKLDLLDRGVLSDAVYDRIKDCVIAHRDKQ